MNNIKKIIKDIIKVTASNFFVLLAGILSGFIIPKIMNVSNYGYYKTFGLYISYSSLFRLGIVDGIFLLYGGMNYKDLDKSEFRYYSKFLIFLETIIMFSLILFSFFVLDGEYKYIFYFVAIYIWAFNITSYYQIISQITSRFNELSIRNLLQAIFSSIAIVVFYYLFKVHNFNLNYKIYTFCYVFIQLFLTIWYIITYREITFGKSDKHKISKIIELIKLGIPLLIANLCSTLILTLDRQFVNILFDNNKYAIYAFAYNMLSLVTVATTAISTVIYPVLKRSNRERMNNIYDKLISVVLIFVFMMLSLYFILNLFIRNFLPKYIASLNIFKIIFPGLAINSAISIVMHNYYKIMNDNVTYFKKSLIVLFISFLFNLIAYLIFKSMESISIVSILSIFIWYIIMEKKFIIECNVRYRKNRLYIIFCVALYYVIAFMFDNLCGLIIYILFISIVTYRFFAFDIKKILKILGDVNNEKKK